jgi:hypothetical protein
LAQSDEVPPAQGLAGSDAELKAPWEPGPEGRVEQAGAEPELAGSDATEASAKRRRLAEAVRTEDLMEESPYY